jgi:hypothetical protein
MWSITVCQLCRPIFYARPADFCGYGLGILMKKKHQRCRKKNENISQGRCTAMLSDNPWY